MVERQVNSHSFAPGTGNEEDHTTPPTHFKNECDWNMFVAGSHWGTACAGWTEGERRKKRNGERGSVGRCHVNEV